MITVNKTTFKIDGCEEKCFEVSDGYTMVRISKMYHYVGKNFLAITEFLDGDYNSSDEWTGDFDSLTEADAKRIAQKYSVYLEK